MTEEPQKSTFIPENISKTETLKQDENPKDRAMTWEEQNEWIYGTKDAYERGEERKLLCEEEDEEEDEEEMEDDDLDFEYWRNFDKKARERREAKEAESLKEKKAQSLGEMRA